VDERPLPRRESSRFAWHPSNACEALADGAIHGVVPLPERRNAAFPGTSEAGATGLEPACGVRKFDLPANGAGSGNEPDSCLSTHPLRPRVPMARRGRPESFPYLMGLAARRRAPSNRS
jgi:hypothetical protein